MGHRPLPPFDSLVANFPHEQTPWMVKKMIGGAADDTAAPRGPAQWLGGPSGDTCTLRMSRAFNYGGGLIPAKTPHMTTVAGADHRRYGFRSREFDAWLRFAYGAPDIEVKGKPIARTRLAGHKGVISFDITFGMNEDSATRALGHVDLWDGKTFYDEIAGISSYRRDFFKVADGVALWLADGKAMLQ